MKVCWPDLRHGICYCLLNYQLLGCKVCSFEKCTVIISNCESYVSEQAFVDHKAQSKENGQKKQNVKKKQTKEAVKMYDNIKKDTKKN